MESNIITLTYTLALKKEKINQLNINVMVGKLLDKISQTNLIVRNCFFKGYSNLYLLLDSLHTNLEVVFI